jgi:RNAse (barnase) inhibitor barstar
MAWKVALVLDTEYSVGDLGKLVHQMPAWAVDTPARREAAPEIRREAGELWAPDPAFTLFTPSGGNDRAEICRSIVGTLLEHHSYAASLQLIGVSCSPDLIEILSDEGFEQASGGFHEGISFRKPIDKLTGVGEVVLDASHWTTANDFYDSFFLAVGAPDWHGRNLDALNDSIATGNINQIEVPYRIVIENLSQAEPEARTATERIIELIHQLEAEGCPIAVTVREP